MSKSLYPDTPAFVLKKSLLLAALLLIFGSLTRISAQCNIGVETNPQNVTPSVCNNGSVNLGSGAYYFLTVNANTYYNWTFTSNACVNGFCATPQNGNAAAFTTNQTGWFSGTTTTLLISASRNGCFSGTSSVMTYRYSTPSITAINATPNPICQGSTLSLTSTTTNVAASNLTWTGPGFSSPGSNNASVTNMQPANAGTYTLTANNSGCSVSATTSSVSVNAPASGSAGTNQTMCSSAGSIAITGASSSNASSISWATSGSGSFNNAAILAPTYTPSGPDIAAGSVTLTLTIHGNSPCGNVTSSKTLTIVGSPTASAGGNQTACSNAGSIPITGATATNTGGGISWGTTGTGSFSNGNTVAPNYIPSNADLAAGSVTLTITVAAISPCVTASSSKTLTFTTAPTAFAGANQTTCSNSGAISLSGATASNNVSLAWSTSGNGSFSSTSALNPTYTPGSTDITNGSVTLTLTAGGNAPCAAAVSSMMLTIVAAPVLSAGGNQTTCSNAGAVAITGASASNQSGLSWNTSGTGSFSNGNTVNPSYTPSPGDIAAGSVILTLTAAGNAPCAQATSSKTLTIIAAPVPNAGGNQSTCSNSGGFTITGASAANATGVNWTSSGTGGFTGAGTLNPTYTPSPADISAGSVVLTLTATGTAPCTTVSSSMTLTIVPAPTVSAGTGLTTCANSGTVNISGASASNYSSLNWTTSGSGTFTNSATLVTGYTPSAADTVAGSVTLTLTANGNVPCASASSSLLLTIDPLPAGSISGTTSICTGNSTTLTFNLGTAGPFNITYTDGTNNYSANGVNNGYTVTVSPTASSTTYQLTSISDNNGCTRPANFLGGATVTVTPLPVISSVAVAPALCFGSSTGSITITATSGIPAYTYSIDGGSTFQNSNVFSGLPQGNSYVLEVEDSHGCSSFYSSNPVTITQPTVLSQTDTSVQASCANVFDGSITVTAAGGVTPYSYSLNGGPSQSGSTFGNLGAGSYVVQVTDFNGCTDTAHVTITNSYAVSVNLVSQTNVSCFGGADGALTVQITGGVPPYSYSDNGSTFQSSPTFTGLTAGNYVITLRDSRGCTDFVQVSITQPGLLDVIIDSVQNVLCSGASQGAIYITVSGGTAPYNYTWSNSATTQDVTNLTAGTYNVTVLDSKGCNASSGATITQPLPLFVNVATVHNLACYNDSSGYIYVSVSGGVPPYSYNWSNSETTQDISDLGIGTYTVTVLDANGCSATISQAVTQPTQLTSTISATNVTCHGASNGAVTFSANGGTLPYTYLWNNGTTTQSLNNVPGGTYSVVVTDGNGCSINNSVTVAEPTAIVLGISSTSVGCNGGTSGTVTTTVSGGTPNYTYLWSNSATTANLTNVGAGTYTVVVTDANSCTASASVTISQPTALVLNGTVVNVSCAGGSNGSVDITVNGGTFPYSYLWSNSATTENINGVSANTYTVVATDANTCSVSASFTVTAPPAITSTVVGTNVTCHGQANGTATLTVGGGISPYTFSWSNFQITQNLSGLSGGIYYVTITDANGCTRRDSVIITEPAAIVLGISGTNVSCNGGTNGAVNTTVTGGTGTITYAWSNSATTANLTNVGAGPYSVTITDANLCTASASVTLTQPTALVLNGTVANVSCAGGNNGSVDITVNGGVFPYSYSWSNSATTQNINALTGGTYTVVVTDANLCTITASFNVNSPTAITSSVVGTNVTCHGQANGTATLTVGGGTPSYTFLWSNFQATQNLTGLSGGTYYVIITDANGCEHRDSVIITEPAAIVLGITGTNVSCNGGTNGAVNTTVTGGTGTITYAWSNSATTANLTNVGAGPYSVTITDANLCTASASVTLTQPTALVLNGTVANVSCAGGNNGSVDITVNGGVFPYTYSWSNSATTQNINALTGGTYTVVVTDANLCTITASFNVNSPTPITSSIVGTNVTCHGQANGTATLTVGGGTPSYTFLWNTFAATQNLTGLSGGTYYVIITDANGCEHRDSVIITEPAAIVLGISGTNVSCNGGSNGTVTTTVTGGTGTINYAWSNSASSPGLTNVAAGTYSVTITDANLCTASASITITQPTAIVINGTVANVACFGGNDGSVQITVNGGVYPYSYLWSNSATTQNVNGLSGGVTYTVTVTDANLCTATASFSVTSPTALTASVTGTNVSCFGANDGSASVVASGGTLPYTNLWSNFQGSSTINNLSGGEYFVIVTDGNGCTTKDSILITEPAQLVITSTVTQITCANANNGAINLTVTGGVPGYTYVWSPTLPGSPNQTGLDGGNYSVTVTDTHSCTVSAQIALFNPPAIGVNFVVTNPKCYGDSNGIINLIPSGGQAPYSYIWSPGGDTTASITNAKVGTYDVTITDSRGCSKVDSARVSTPNQLYTSGVTTNVSCFGKADGEINITVYGGTPPYNFGWSSGPTTQDLYHLTGGTYYVSVSDANQCEVISLYVVNEPTLLNLGLSATNVSCFGGNNGAITSLPSGGTKPYRYAWIGAVSSDSILTNVPAGYYGLQLTDSNGCYAFDSIVVTQPTRISISGYVNNVICFNTATGSVVTSSSGGTPGYTYSWSNGGIDSSINTISAGVYVITVTDASNCTQTASFNVQQGPKININLAKYDPVCFGGNTGSMTALVAGGTEPYHFVWSSGAADTAVSIDHLLAGTYIVTVTDNVGCNITASGSLNQPAAITITPAITGATCASSPTGVVAVNTTGGTAPYNYSLNGIGQSSDTFNHVLPGYYDLEVTDVNGCQGSDTFTIYNPNTISVTLSVNDQVIVTGMETQLSANATSSAPITNYIWSPITVDSADVFDYSSCPDSTDCSTPYVKPPFTTIFTVTAVNADGCVASDTVTVYVHGEQGLQFLPTAFTPNGDGLNDRFTFAILGATTVEVAIFDRWGQRVYFDGAQPNGISNSYGWDGTVSGKEAPSDTYVYQFKVTYFDNTVKNMAGTITLIR